MTAPIYLNIIRTELVDDTALEIFKLICQRMKRHGADPKAPELMVMMIARASKLINDKTKLNYFYETVAIHMSNQSKAGS